MNIDFSSYFAPIKRKPIFRKVHSYRPEEDMQLIATVREWLKGTVEEYSLFDTDVLVTEEAELEASKNGSAYPLLKKRYTGEEIMKMVNGKNLTLLQQAEWHHILNRAQGKLLSREEAKADMQEYLKLNDDQLIHLGLAEQQSATMEVDIKLQRLFFVEALKKSLMKTLELKRLSGWIDQDWVKKYAVEKIKEFENGKFEEEIASMIDGLRESVMKTNEEGRLKIIIGSAGCGKSTMASTISRKYVKKAVIAISNTVVNYYVAKKDPGCEGYSATRARFKGIKDQQCIVIDEFSQWGLYEATLFKALLDDNPRAQFVIMGDDEQIPTFLSSGSLLHTVANLCKGSVTRLTTQHRFKNCPEYRDLIDSLRKGEIPDDLMIEALTDEVIMDTDCFITGTNKNVNWLNGMCLTLRNPEIKSKIQVDQNGKVTNLAELISQINDYKSIPLMADATVKLKSKDKIFTNTRYQIVEIHRIGFGYQFILKSLVDGKEIRCTDKEIDYKFTLCYAITVNKSQGLEWPRVCVYVTSMDRNLKNYNAMNVAITRGTTKTVTLLTDQKKSFSKEDLKNLLKKKYIFHKMF